MIFNNDAATKLYYLWRSEPDDCERERYLEEFLEISNSLIEALTWKYSTQMDHEDLIQESTIKVIAALHSYDPTITSLHTFLTTVIINQCNTCVSKEKRQTYANVELNESVEPKVFQDCTDTEIIDDLIKRNRERFPSLNVEMIDEITRTIYAMTQDGAFCKSKGIISTISKRFPINRHKAIVVYHSTLVYLRRTYIDGVVLQDIDDPDEFSLLYDFLEYFGDDAYIRLYDLFAGTFLKIP